MSKGEADLLLVLYRGDAGDQRDVTVRTGCSLGKVNAMVKSLQTRGLLSEAGKLTESAKALLAAEKPKNAVILAAGTGLRMAPFNTELPKALLTVRGKKIIEWLIRQLQEAGVSDIAVVVGFMKESFEYLIATLPIGVVILLIIISFFKDARAYLPEGKDSQRAK